MNGKRAKQIRKHIGYTGIEWELRKNDNQQFRRAYYRRMKRAYTLKS